MRIFPLAFVLAIATVPVVAFADETPVRDNQIQADLGLAVVGLGYERTLHRHVALQAGAYVFGTWFGPLVDLPNLAGAGVELRPTVFVSGTAPTGIYVSPFFRLGMATHAGSDPALGWSTGSFVGYSVLLGERVNLRGGLGAQYMHYVVDSPAIHAARFVTFFPAIDLVLGYTF